MAYTKLFDELRREAQKLEKGYQIHISGNKQKQTMLNKHLQKWWDEILFDVELEIISLDDYQNTYDVLRESINNMEIY